jgi:hypothetical protein
MAYADPDIIEVSAAAIGTCVGQIEHRLSVRYDVDGFACILETGR